jgi:hypothetical protein
MNGLGWLWGVAMADEPAADQPPAQVPTSLPEVVAEEVPLTSFVQQFYNPRIVSHETRKREGFEPRLPPREQ